MITSTDLGGIALTPMEAELRVAAQTLTRDVFAVHAEAVDREGAFPRASLDAVRSAGLLNVPIPQRFGGRGGSVLATAVITEEAARGCASTAMALAMHYSIVPVLFMKATEEQAAGLLGPIARGEAFASIAASEAGSGTRLWHMDGYSAKDGDEYVLHATKSFVTGSGYANHYVVPVRSSPTASPDDLDVFIVPANHPGVERIGSWDAMGLRGNDSRPVRFEGARVRAEVRLGASGDGFGFLLGVNMPHYMVTLAAAYVGIAQGALDFAIQHARGRTHTDTEHPLSTVETVQRYVGTAKGLIDQMRCTMYRNARLVDRSIPVLQELAEAGILDQTLRKKTNDSFFSDLLAMKASICETARTVVDQALQVCGGRGFKRGSVVERAYRDVRAGSLMAPSDDIAKLVVGRQVLGVPQPWA